LGELAQHPRVHLCDAPMLDLSATYIRQCIKNGLSVRYLVPDSVWEYLENNFIYRT